MSDGEEEVKKAKKAQKSLSKAVANLENPKNDIVFLDDDNRTNTK